MSYSSSIDKKKILSTSEIDLKSTIKINITKSYTRISLTWLLALLQRSYWEFVESNLTFFLLLWPRPMSEDCKSHHYSFAVFIWSMVLIDTTYSMRTIYDHIRNINFSKFKKVFLQNPKYPHLFHYSLVEYRQYGDISAFHTAPILPYLPDHHD